MLTSNSSSEMSTNMRHCQEHDTYYNQAQWQCGKCFEKQKTDLVKLQEEIKSWREAWYETREINGRLSWTVPNVRFLKGSPWPFFQQQYQRFVQIAKELEEEDFFRELLHRPEFVSFFERDPFPSPLMTMLGDD